MTSLKSAVVGLFALTAFADCGERDEDDALTTCFPESVRNTCMAELSLEFHRTCYDGSGSCSYSKSQDASGYHFLFEWENGARIGIAYSESDSNTTSMMFQPASGERCTSTIIETAECSGSRVEFNNRWYEVCIESDGAGSAPSTVHFTCDDGSQFSLSSDEMSEEFSDGPSICEEQLGNPFEDCEDPEGQLLGDKTVSPTVLNCSPEACGNIASRCSDARPCDQGLICQSISDPPGFIGFCALPCEDLPCPTGTECTNVLDRQSNDVIPLCLRTCSSQVDCDPYGSLCMGTADNQTGFCN